MGQALPAGPACETNVAEIGSADWSIAGRSFPTVKSHGCLDLELVALRGATTIARDHQSGCLRSRQLNRRGDEPLTVATINTAGGLTGGDHLHQSIRWREASSARITTPAAEKIYRANSGVAKIETTLRVDEHAWAEFLPQETILFDGAKLDRSMTIDLGESASFLYCDAVIYGRHAHCETVNSGALTDTIRLRRAGRLVLFDRTTVTDFSRWRAEISTLGGFRASGTVLFAASDCEKRLAEAQAASGHMRGLVGASLLRGILHIRLLAASDADLRHDLSRMLIACRPDLTLPRNWSC